MKLYKTRIIHCYDNGKYRVQVWRVIFPMWVTEENNNGPLEWNSKEEAHQYLVSRDMIDGQWQPIE